jgi:Predicted membrane protein
VLGILDKMLGWQRASGEGILTTIYGVLIFLPWWAVQFRRLHDTDRSAWWLLLLIIPIIGWLVIIIFNCQSGTPGENRFWRGSEVEFVVRFSPLTLTLSLRERELTVQN